MSLLCPEGDTDRQTPIAAPEISEVRAAVRQLRPQREARRNGELAEQNKYKNVLARLGTKKRVYLEPKYNLCLVSHLNPLQTELHI